MKREEVIEQGMRLLKDVREDEHFKTVDGRTLKSVRELVLLLETYHDDHFRHHVNEHRNDFAAWVEHSIGDRVLAERIREADSQQGIQQAISNRLEELEAKLLALESGEPEASIAPEHDVYENAVTGEEDELEALVGDVDPDARFGRDELLEEIESAIAQAQAQLKVERGEEQRPPEDLTGEPDEAISEPVASEEPAQSRAEKKLERDAQKQRKREEKEARRREKEKERARKKAAKRRKSEKNDDKESGGFSLTDFFIGFGFGAVIGGVAGVIIALLLL